MAEKNRNDLRKKAYRYVFTMISGPILALALRRSSRRCLSLVVSVIAVFSIRELVGSFSLETVIAVRDESETEIEMFREKIGFFEC
jgi:hypothetical protein